MKRNVTLTVAPLVSLFALSAFAATAKVQKPVSHGTEIKGTISSINDAGKSFVLAVAGKNDTISWTSATKVYGGPLKATQNVVVRAMEKDGKWIATSVRVEPAKAAAAAPAAAPAAAHAAAHAATKH